MRTIVQQKNGTYKTMEEGIKQLIKDVSPGFNEKKYVDLIVSLKTKECMRNMDLCMPWDAVTI